MGNHDYYWELNIERGAFQAIGPKRTLGFFLEAVRRGRQHILDLYARRGKRDKGLIGDIVNKAIIREARKVILSFRLRDNDLEYALAQILVNFIRFPEQNTDKLCSIYLFDLVGRFVLNPEREDSLTERICEYASFRASADYVTLTYGIHSKPELELTRAEAEILKRTFTQDKKVLSIDEILRNGRLFYEHASATAQQILDNDFFRLTDRDKRNWERRARLNEKISRKYNECLEILRTAHYKFFH